MRRLLVDFNHRDTEGRVRLGPAGIGRNVDAQQYECPWCGRVIVDQYSLSEHADDCPWLAARKALEAP